MRRVAVFALSAAAFLWSYAPRDASSQTKDVNQIAAKLAGDLARGCPHSDIDNVAAFQSCTQYLTRAGGIPFAPGVLWGGDQADKRIRKRHLTHFSADVFRTMYLPLMTFTGNYTIARDEREKLNIIKVEAYFRNALPAGDYPYPFWHASAKWDAYEVMNVINFYVNDQGQIVVITRAANGSDKNRGEYARVARPPVSKDPWVWTDEAGHQQPKVALFASRYQAANPSLPRLDETYRAFAASMRETACLSCHVPNNPAGSDQLILLQTPLHAAAEINRVIRSIQSANMPQDDIGLPKEIDPQLRASILRTAQAFRDELVTANLWEATQGGVANLSLPAPAPGDTPLVPPPLAHD